MGLCIFCEEIEVSKKVHIILKGRPEEEFICESCLNDYDVCADCLYYTRNDQSLEAFHNIYCTECFSENFAYCNDCDDLFSRGDLDNGLCEYCSENTTCSLINPYSYKPDPIYYGGRGVIKYGVELEVTHKNTYTTDKVAQDVLDILGSDHVYLKEDGTITDPGFEIVSHPHTMKAHRALWVKEFFELPLLEKSTNGMHVHIQRIHLGSKGLNKDWHYLGPKKPRSDIQIAKMLEFINSERNEDFIIDIAGRICDEYANINKYVKAKNYKDSIGKYTALNTLPRSTVELRIFASTTSYERFFSNLEFCDALVSFTKYNGIGGMNYESFIKFVKKYKKLYKYLYKFLVSKKYIEKANERNS